MTIRLPEKGLPFEKERSNGTCLPEANRCGLILVTGLSALSGCVSKSEYDAKVAELKTAGERLTKAEQTLAEVERGLSAAKGEIDNAQLATKKADAKIDALTQEHASLKEQLQALPQAKERASHLQRELDEAKTQLEAARKAAADADDRVRALEREKAEREKQPSKALTPKSEPKT